MDLSGHQGKLHFLHKYPTVTLRMPVKCVSYTEAADKLGRLREMGGGEEAGGGSAHRGQNSRSLGLQPPG